MQSGYVNSFTPSGLSFSGEPRAGTGARQPLIDDDTLFRIRARHFRALVVDDHAMFRRALLRKLRRLYHVTASESSSAVGAIGKVKTGEQFDLIFMDVAMERMGGVEACAAIQALGTQAQLILMSADEANGLKAAAAGLPFYYKSAADALERVLVRCLGGTS
jgi:CheY-like chemotaxis protein